MFPEFILRAFPDRGFRHFIRYINLGGVTSEINAQDSQCQPNQSYTCLWRPPPPEGKRWSLRGSLQLSQHEEPDGGNSKGKVARESELRAGLGCLASGQPCLQVLLAPDRPLWQRWWQHQGLQLTERSLHARHGAKHSLFLFSFTWPDLFHL